MEIKYLQNNLVQLKKAINQDRLVIFAGAGVSFDSGLPLGNNLLEKIKKKLNFDTQEDDPLKLAQLLHIEKGEKDYNEILKNLIFESCTTANPIHEILFTLNPQHIVTTNYDYFFEEIIDQDGLPFSIISKDQDLPYAEHKNLVIKYHGDFQNKNIVLKETDYLEYSKTNILKETFVKSLFSNKVILFVGYSFSDINLKILLREVQHLLKKHQQKSYLIIPDENVPNSEISYFNNFGINIINFDPNLFLDDYQKDKLSKKGQKVYSILNFLAKLEIFDHDYFLTEEADAENIIESAFQSLKRFEIFGVLPKIFIADLYPFNKAIKQPPDYNIIEDRILVFSKNVYEALLQGFSSEKELDDFTDKSFRIKKILLMSGINEIAYVDKPKSLGQFIPEDENIFRLSTRKTGINCKCFDCSLNRFEYQEIQKKQKAYRISSTTDIFEDLKYSYVLYEIGDYLNSFKAFQNLLQKSNKQRRFDISFLSKFNLVNLSKYLYRSYTANDEIEEDDYEKFKQVVDSINLDKELEKLKFFYDKDVYNLYKNLNNGKIVHRLCIEIDSLKFTTLETLDRIKGGGSGGKSFIELLNRMKELDNFLRVNHIIADNPYEVNHSFQKSIESLIIGYKLKNIPHISRGLNLGKPHLKCFNYWICVTIIRRSIPEILYKALRNWEIENIELCKSDRNKIFNQISQFLKNGYDNNKFFGGSRRSEMFNTNYQGKTTFKLVIDRQFSNICILLSYLDIEEENFISYIDSMTEFLRYIVFNETSDSLKYLNIFFLKKSHLFSQKNLNEILAIIYENYGLNNIFYTLLKNSKEETTLGFVDVNRVNFHVLNFSSTNLFPLLNNQQQKVYKENLRAEIEIKNGSYYLYFDAINNNIITEPEFIQKFKEDINSLLQLEIDNNSRNLIFYNHQIHLFLTLLFENKIDLSFLDLDKIHYKYYQFLFNLNNFPESDFDLNWLKYKRPKIIDDQVSNISFVYDKIEKYLLDNDDPEYRQIYFQLKKRQSRIAKLE
ncbi:SIR2 family protein [Antarcticibacterium sp. 1MA-6-2]|uniref:SIR2 family protein n=1 Tax=Antarcticibacterium sp. 1MA-6-2 TaxID=2908210 RepID=UPI001F4240D9|nr:SIR2 family protein [Antarcticibacterium sp. 1MA-6-2]UJH92079.1 SIR2 family protein [Antarcticibacterium sp. 1MA-6-2]